MNKGTSIIIPSKNDYVSLNEDVIEHLAHRLSTICTVLQNLSSRSHCMFMPSQFETAFQHL